MKIPQGFLLSGIHCGIKKEKIDLGLIYCKDFSKAVGFFTTNTNPSYSVTVSKKNINRPIKAVIVNSGNANCFSHKTGFVDTEDIITKLAYVLKAKKENILIASTGIIGKRLPKEKIITGFPELVKNLGEDIKPFSASIQTTDTFEKIVSRQVLLQKGKGSILGFAKGAGMIAPNMATMLSFILTDIALPLPVLRQCARTAVTKSFNSITIDGCMSTNDTVFILSSGKVKPDNKKDKEAFIQALEGVCLDLAKLIVRDGEGATKFIEIEIKGAKTENEAKAAGLAMANSNLLKCALYGEDPNWGRIIAALGHAGIAVKENVGVETGSLKQKDIKIKVDLKHGKAGWVIYTSDLTPEYVKINAEYS